MKITLFGATGKTGKYLINEALKLGFDVTVFARSATSFEEPRVQVVRGDLADMALLREAIRGSDAVVSALGPTSFPHPRDLPIARATQAIISAMGEEDVRRLIAVSTGTAVDPGDGSDWKIWFPALVIKYAMRSTYDDIVGLAKAIRNSNLDWTMVRAAVLKSNPASMSTNVGLYGHTRHSWTVNREDLAIFMLDQISRDDFVRQAPGISSLKV